MICEKIAAATRVKSSVCEAKLAGTKKQLVACIGAENMLKKEGVSMSALRKMTKTELLKRVETRRKQVATCRVQVASLNGQVLEGKKCQAQMAHMKSKFKGVAAYLKANANKWKKKDVLEHLEEKKSGAQARAMARGLSRAERKIARRNAELKKEAEKTARPSLPSRPSPSSSAHTSVPCVRSCAKLRRCSGRRRRVTTRSGCRRP